jgi:hypothetical protein
MIRKLTQGTYRLYSRKIDPKTKRRRNLGSSKRAQRQKSTSAMSSTSSDTS